MLIKSRSIDLGSKVLREGKSCQNIKLFRVGVKDNRLWIMTARTAINDTISFSVTSFYKIHVAISLIFVRELTYIKEKLQV